MKNLSLGSKVHYLVAAALALLLVFGYQAGSAGRLSTAAWATFTLLVVVLALSLYTVYRILWAVDNLTRKLRQAADGNLDQRITRIKRGGATHDLAWALNDLLDQQEAYFSEVFSAFDHAARGQTFRLAVDQGLHGAFKDAMKRINISVGSLGQVQQMALKEKLVSQVTEIGRAHV